MFLSRFITLLHVPPRQKLISSPLSTLDIVRQFKRARARMVYLHSSFATVVCICIYIFFLPARVQERRERNTLAGDIYAFCVKYV